MVVTTVFRNNRTQAVRLPKAVALPDDVRQVEVRTVGASRIISPVGASWDDWFDTWEPMSDGFACEREYPTQRRDVWWS